MQGIVYLWAEGASLACGWEFEQYRMFFII